MISSSVETFLSDLRETHKFPSGKFEKSKVPKIQIPNGLSSGKAKSRFCFDELEDDFFRVAASIKKCCAPFGNYKIAQITCDGQTQDIWLNVKSVMNRFDLPKDVVMGNLSNLNTIVRIVAEKRLLHNSTEEVVPVKNVCGCIYLESISKPFSSLIPLEEIAQMAQRHNRCFHLSKRCYRLAKSIDIHPGGFIAIDTGKFLGEGRNATAKISTTLQGVEIARRSTPFDIDYQIDHDFVLRTMKVFNEFREKTGVLDTLSIGVYENKLGTCKFVSFHPLYDQDYKNAWQIPLTEKEQLMMAHQLLQGLSAIAELGNHRDITENNVFLRRAPVFEAVIADLEAFRYHSEKEDEIWNSTPGPESYGTKREVWDVGKILYYVLQPKIDAVDPWDFSSEQDLITQQNLDYAMKFSEFPPELELLLRGMLALDPSDRWTAKESLDHFETYLSSIQDVPVISC